MSIIDNLRRAHVAVTVDTFNNGDLGKRIGNAAVAAITKGIGSEEWKKYMALFCDTPQELQYLTVPDPENEPNYMPQARAYICANAVCASDTGTQTANGILNSPQIESIEPIAGTLAAAENPADVRPFTIP